MKKFSLAHIALWGLVPAMPQMDSHFERFQQLAVDSIVEDNLSRDIRTTETKALLPSKFEMVGLPSELKVEWALRLGSKAAGLSFRDVIYISRPEVLDEALWLLFTEQIGKTYFTDLDTWRGALSNFSKLLRRPELNAAVFEQAHGPWWLWMKNSKLPKNAGDELKAVNTYLEALLEKDATGRLEGLLKSYELWTQVLIPELQIDSLGERLYMEARTKKKISLDQVCAEHMLSCQGLSNEFYKRQQIVEALAWWEASKPSEFSARVRLADLYFENGRYKTAADLFVKLYKEESAKEENKDAVLLAKLEVHSFVSRMRSDFLKKNFDDGATAGRDKEISDMLEKHFSSIWRDTLLDLRVDFAKNLGRRELAVERSIFKFQYALSRDERLKGLREALDLRAQNSSVNSSMPYPELKRFVSELSLLKRLEPDASALSGWIKQARSEAQKLRGNFSAEIPQLVKDIDSIEKGRF